MGVAITNSISNLWCLTIEKSDRFATDCLTWGGHFAFPGCPGLGAS